MAGVDLFGIDIADLVYQTFTGQLVTLTMTRKTLTQAASGAVTTSSTATYTCDGIADAHSEQWASLLNEGERSVLVMGDSFKDSSGAASTVIPKPGDQITDDTGETLDVLGLLERDPAAATYLLRCK